MRSIYELVRFPIVAFIFTRFIISVQRRLPFKLSRNFVRPQTLQHHNMEVQLPKNDGRDPQKWRSFLNRLSQNPTAQLVACTVIGFILGIVIANTSLSPVAKSWFGFPGELFLRALKCLVIPMIFLNMVCGVADISGLGQVGRVGSVTFKAYMFTTTIAAVEGLAVVLLFRGLFSISSQVPSVEKNSKLQFHVRRIIFTTY